LPYLNERKPSWSIDASCFVCSVVVRSSEGDKTWTLILRKRKRWIFPNEWPRAHIETWIPFFK
jgi:hypothetical protein